MSTSARPAGRWRGFHSPAVLRPSLPEGLEVRQLLPGANGRTHGQIALEAEALAQLLNAQLDVGSYANGRDSGCLAQLDL